MDFFFPLYDIDLNPSDTIQDIAINLLDSLCLGYIYCTKSTIISDYEIARAIEALAILLDVQLGSKTDVFVVASQRVVVVADSCVTDAVAVTTTPSNARAWDAVVIRVTRVFCRPFSTIS